MAEQRRARPAPHRTGREPADRQVTSSRAVYGCTASHGDAVHAELALRIAWLRVHADLLYDVDESGLLSAQLLDLADLLEILGRAGRVVW